MRETLEKMGISTLEQFINLFEYEQGVIKPAVYVNTGNDFDDINLIAYGAKNNAYVQKQSAPVLSKKQVEDIYPDPIGMNDLPF